MQFKTSSNLMNMRKCGLMFVLLVIVLIIASRVNEIDKNIKADIAVAYDLHVTLP